MHRGVLDGLVNHNFLISWSALGEGGLATMGGDLFPDRRVHLRGELVPGRLGGRDRLLHRVGPRGLDPLLGRLERRARRLQGRGLLPLGKFRNLADVLLGLGHLGLGGHDARRVEMERRGVFLPLASGGVLPRTLGPVEETARTDPRELHLRPAAPRLALD